MIQYRLDIGEHVWDLVSFNFKSGKTDDGKTDQENYYTESLDSAIEAFEQELHETDSKVSIHLWEQCIDSEGNTISSKAILKSYGSKVTI